MSSTTIPISTPAFAIFSTGSRPFQNFPVVIEVPIERENAGSLVLAAIHLEVVVTIVVPYRPAFGRRGSEALAFNARHARVAVHDIHHDAALDSVVIVIGTYLEIGDGRHAFAVVDEAVWKNAPIECNTFECMKCPAAAALPRDVFAFVERFPTPRPPGMIGVAGHVDRIFLAIELQFAFGSIGAMITIARQIFWRLVSVIDVVPVAAEDIDVEIERQPVAVIEVNVPPLQGI